MARCALAVTIYVRVAVALLGADCCRRRSVTPQPSKLSSTMILASHLVVLPLAFVVGVQQVVDCQAVLTLSPAL